MPRDPKVNSLVRIEAKNNKLEGSIDVLQDRPELQPDLSGSYIVLDNQDAIYTTLVAYPNGQNPRLTTGSEGGLLYEPFKRGLNPGAGVFGSPFIVPPKILQTFEEGSGLDDIFDSGTTDQRAYLTEDGKYANSAIPFKQQELRKELDIKWSGRKIDGLAPLSISVGAYSTISPNWQVPLSPDAPQQFQTGNLWVQQPIENLWQGDEVIWKLTSGSGFEQGNRVGRNLITGIVGPTTATLGLMPVIDGVRTTGSSAVTYQRGIGAPSSQERFLNGGAIRDNSSSRTLGSHFRPDNNITRQSRAELIIGSEVYLLYQNQFIENSGKLILSSSRKVWDYQEVINQSDRFDDQPKSIVKYRSPEYTASGAPLKVNKEFGFINRVLGGGAPTIVTREAKVSGYDASTDLDIFQNDYEGVFARGGESDISGSMSFLNRAILYDFYDKFIKVAPESTFLPVDKKLYIGSPIRLYFGDTTPRSVTPRTFSRMEELILLTSRGQIFIKRDLGLTDSQFSNLEYLDFADERLFFASEDELLSTGKSRIQIGNINSNSLVEVVGAIGLFDFDASSSTSQRYSSFLLQYYKVPCFKSFYYNSCGHTAHLLDSGPYSYSIIGSQGEPATDPGFFNSSDIGSFAINFDDSIKYAVDKVDVGKFYFSLYNPQYGKPASPLGGTRIISNLVSSFNSENSITASANYNFTDGKSVKFENTSNTPFVTQGLLKNYTVEPVAAESSVDLSTTNFSQNGTVPVVPFSDFHKNPSDVFGNGYLSDLPYSYNPIFDSNGDIYYIFGSDIDIKVSTPDLNDSVIVGSVDKNLISIAKNNPNITLLFDTNSRLGIAPVNLNQNIGFGYKAYFSNLVAKSSASINVMAFNNTSLPDGVSRVNNDFSGFLLPRIGAGVTTVQGAAGENTFPNFLYWAKGIGVGYNPLASSIILTGSQIMWMNKQEFNYPQSLLTCIDETSRALRGFTDFDIGRLKKGFNNSTKNVLNPKNSDAFINTVDNDERNKFGIFAYSQNLSGSSDFSYPFTGSVELNYLYGNVTSRGENNLINHNSDGFTQADIKINNQSLNSSNKLHTPDSPVFLLETKNKIDNKNFIWTSNGQSNKCSFAAYCISDSEQLYASATFSNASLYENVNYVPPKPSGTPTVPFPPSVSFLNFPISQSNTADFPGVYGQSAAYINHRTYYNDKFYNVLNATPLHFYAENKFFVHPKGINYAFSTTDKFFGTAELDDTSNDREIVQTIDFLIENSTYQDAFDQGAGPDAAGAVERNYRSNTSALSSFAFPLYGIPAGIYTFVLNIQDMIPPPYIEAWVESAPPSIFSAVGPNGEDNGLRSNFYWRISECNLARGIFGDNFTIEQKNNQIFSARGTFNGISGPNPNSGLTPPMGIDDLTYEESNFALMIEAADDFIFETKDNSLSGDDQYKGVFVPDPTNPTLGQSGLNKFPSNDYPKRIKITLRLENTMPMSSFDKLVELAIVLRPNETIPTSIIEPTLDVSGNLKTWSPYVGEEYENALRFNTGNALCFARISSFGSYESLYPFVVSDAGSISSGSTPSKRQSTITNYLPYDPFNHDPNSTTKFPVYSIGTTIAGINNTIYALKTPIGYHSLLSYGESCKEFDIGILNSETLTYNENENANAVNRSIIDQAQSLNIINLSGMAVSKKRRTY